MSDEKKLALNGDDCAVDEDDDQHKRQTTGMPTNLALIDQYITYNLKIACILQAFLTGELLHEFWETSSLQGLPRVFTETIRFWKFFWFSLFLLLLAGCIYQVYFNPL